MIAESLAGKRIATSYPATLSRWLQVQGVRADVVQLSGSVEIAPRLGKAEAICDLVSSGGTLAASSPCKAPANRRQSVCAITSATQ